MRKWLESYERHLAEERDKSAGTIRSYKTDLADFIGFAESQGAHDVADLRSSHVQSYLTALRKQSRSASTIARRLVALRNWCKYLTICRTIAYDPTLQIEAPKVERKPVRALEELDVEKLLSAPDTESPYGIRDRAMLELLYAAGLRVSELTALDVGHLHLEFGFLRCTSPDGRERLVPVAPSAASWVKKYVDEARPRLLGVEPTAESEQALFIGSFGTRLTRQGFWKAVKKAAATAGIAENAVSPLALRRAFAVHLLGNGADVRAVQEMLGHAATVSTEYYRTSVKPKVKETYDSAHPKARRTNSSAYPKAQRTNSEEETDGV